MNDTARCYVLAEPLKLTGIGKGFVEVKHWVTLNFNNKVSHKFLVAEGKFKLREDGILGGDFFENQGVQVNYELNEVRSNNYCFKLNSLIEKNIKME